MTRISETNWLNLSKSNNISWNIINNHHDKLRLEYIVINDELPFGLREKTLLKFADEIDWTIVAFYQCYRAKNTQEDTSNNDDEQLLYKYITNYEDAVHWDKLFQQQYNADVNNKFLKKYAQHLNWTKVLEYTENYIDSSIIYGAYESGYLNWKEISANTSFPERFLQEFQEFIQWDVYLEHNAFESIPEECLNQENILLAVKLNPENIHKLADHGLYSLASDYLRGKVWIDRIPDGEEHYADDSTIQSESLMEHKWLDRAPQDALHYNDEQDYNVLQETDSDLFNERIAQEEHERYYGPEFIEYEDNEEELDIDDELVR